jgi:hypothetical protein
MGDSTERFVYRLLFGHGDAIELIVSFSSMIYQQGLFDPRLELTISKRG